MPRAVHVILGRLCTYEFYSRVLGAVLLLSGLLKTHVFFFPQGEVVPARAMVLLYLGECIAGVWILAGLFPLITRVIAIFIFVAFLNVSLSKAFAGLTSCGCMGRLSVTPWYAVAFDVVAIGFLWFVAPRAHNSTFEINRFKIRGFALTSVFLICSVAAGLVSSALNRGLAYANDVSRHQLGLVENIRKAIHTNNAYATIGFQVETIVFDPSVKVAERLEVKRPGGGRAVLYRAPESRFRHDYRIAGDDLRRDCLANCAESAGEIVVRSKSKALQFIPNMKRAWLRDDHEFGPEPLDPRFVGFSKPIRSIEEWFRSVAITKVEEATRDSGHEITVTTTGEKQNVVTVVFAEALSYLPIAITHWHDDQSIFKTCDLRYLRVGETTWFLKEAKMFSYERGVAYKRNQPGWGSATTYSVVDAPTLNPSLAANTFDPKLPEGTYVINQIQKGSSTLKQPKSVTELASKEGGSRRVHRELFAANFGLLGFFFLFRRNFTFQKGLER